MKAQTMRKVVSGEMVVELRGMWFGWGGGCGCFSEGWCSRSPVDVSGLSRDVGGKRGRAGIGETLCM